MTTVHKHIYDVLKHSKHIQSILHVAKARHFNVDNWVRVDRQNLQVKAGNITSLTHQWLGPYKVIEAIVCLAYQLELPKSTRSHKPVHATLVKPFRR